jgi:hypothetical protein
MKIEQILQKFYDGVSTPEEEGLLMEYFLNEENMNERLKKDQQIFRLLHDAQIQVPAGVSERLEESIMQMGALSEVSHKSLPRKRTLYYWISSAAAIALLCIGLFFANRESAQPKLADTFSDPEEAAWVAHQTLAFMSAQLNKGLDMASDAEQKFEQVNQVLNKHLNK